MRKRVFALTLAMLTAGCGDGDRAGGTVIALDSALVDAAGDSAVRPSPGFAPGLPQDDQHDFLRLVTDHHEGLVVMGADAAARAADDSVTSAARRLRETWVAQQDTMTALIQRLYAEPYSPTIMPRNAAQADSLRMMSPGQADRYFLSTTIGHHRDGIRTIDRFLPALTDPEVRRFTERMRARQERNIAELQEKLRSM